MNNGAGDRTANTHEKLHEMTRKLENLTHQFPAEWHARSRVLSEQRGGHLFVQFVSSFKIPTHKTED